MERKKFCWRKRIAFALVFSILTGFVWSFAVKYVSKEFKPNNETSDVGAVITQGQSNGISLMSATIAPEDFDKYGVAATAESAVTLTATVNPSNATNKKVDWTVAFVNPSSAWATGKNVADYVKITATTDGTLTATVSCLAAFGEQIKITATSRADSSKFASCTADYAKRYDEYLFHLCGGDEQEGDVFDGEGIMWDGKLNDGFWIEQAGTSFTDGTKSETINAWAWAYVREDTLSVINAALGTNFVVAAKNGLDVLIDDTHLSYFGDLIGVDGSGETLKDDATNRAILEDYLVNHQTVGGDLVLFTLKFVFEGVEQGKTEKIVNVYIDPLAIAVSVQSVSLNDSGITF